VVTEDGQGLYDLTAVGAALKSAPAGSPRDAVLFMTSEWVWRAWGELIYSVRTGKPAFDYVWGMSNFEFWGQNSEMGRLFDRGLAAITTQQLPALIAAYDYSRFRTIVDIGGGHGALLSAILRANPAAQGILFDLPHVVARAEEALAEAGLAERCRMVSGSFFDSAPPGGDAYLLKFILHDWDDERASHILQVVHRAMPPGSTLLILEQVMPGRIEPTEYLQEFFQRDLKMLVETSGGRERTAEEFRTLLAAAGFELRTIYPTRSVISIVESVRA
jgi:predicted O-methyltransferase YrrM